jgi:perosamine synthetase
VTVPAAPTLGGLRPAGRLRTKWKTWFPFDQPGGWAFSGRVALYHGIQGLGLPHGSTILVPNYHEGVELDAVLAAGCRVRYYRVDPALHVDLEDVERRLDPSVAALYVIHYFGLPQRLSRLRSFCNSHGIRLIEDCALALFSCSNTTSLGSVGDLAIFSLYKTLPLPHGGYLVSAQRPPALGAPPAMSTLVQTLDLVHHTLEATGLNRIERVATRVSGFVKRMFRFQRQATVSSGGSRWDPRLVTYGVSRWTRQLVRLTNRDAVITRRRANYERLVRWLRPYASIPFPDLGAGVCPLLLPILVPHREQAQAQLQALGVQTGSFWPTSHETCPPDLAAEVAPWRERCLELPIHQELSQDAVDRVARAVIEVLTKH